MDSLIRNFGEKLVFDLIINSEEYMNCDSKEDTTPQLTDDDIIQMVQNHAEDNNAEEEKNDEKKNEEHLENEREVISVRKSSEYIEKIIIYVEQNTNKFKDEEIQFINDLKNKFSSISNHTYQTKISDFL